MGLLHYSLSGNKGWWKTAIMVSGLYLDISARISIYFLSSFSPYAAQIRWFLCSSLFSNFRWPARSLSILCRPNSPKSSPHRLHVVVTLSSFSLLPLTLQQRKESTALRLPELAHSFSIAVMQSNSREGAKTVGWVGEQKDGVSKENERKER